MNLQEMKTQEERIEYINAQGYRKDKEVFRAEGFRCDVCNRSGKKATKLVAANQEDLYVGKACSERL